MLSMVRGNIEPPPTVSEPVGGGSLFTSPAVLYLPQTHIPQQAIGGDDRSFYET